MKKKLQLEIKQLANQLIALDGNFKTSETKQIVARLYEKVAVLEHLENQVSGGPITGENVSLDSKSFREEHWFKEPEQLPESDNKEELVEPLMEKIKDIVAQMPVESQQIDELLEEVLPPKKYIKNDLEEFATNYQQTPTFERKVVEKPKTATTLEEREPAKGGTVPKATTNLIEDIGISGLPKEEKPKSLNEAINSGLSIGLNDRLAFIKQLFNGNADDFARVLSQINTLESFEEAETFIEGKVKPDYDNWLHKEEFTERFMAIVEKRFN